MKNFKFYYLFAFVLIGSFVVASCGDDEDDEMNTITITIEEPTGDNIAMADCGDVHVHIDIVASDENHEVEIVLHPEGDVDTKIIDFDMHEHDQTITFEQEVDLCNFNPGDCFHLEVEACVDHDCEVKERADVEFCLQ